MERVTPRRVRRLETAAWEARARRAATRLAAETGQPLGDCLATMRRSHRLLEETCRALSATALTDVRQVVRAYARAAGMDPAAVLAEAQRLAEMDRR
jgi:hypothetical protein